MKKTILKSALAALFLAAPAIVAAQQGLVGDCYDCHTMHNSEGGLPVAVVNGAVSADPIANLLRLDCVACHANDPTGGTKLWTMDGGSVVPQVSHAGGMDALAGGNFALGIGDSSKVHNVVDLFAGQWDDNAGDPADTGEFGAPPGTAPAAHYHGFSRSVFTVNFSTPFDAFTCAGARGCHGTRSQLLSGETIDNGTDNNFTNAVRRTGMAAITGAHHNNYDGAKDATNYPEDETAFHDGQRVADGYRFIPGLKGYGNETTRWENVSSTEHNEYYGNNAGTFGLAPEPTSGCGICHVQGHAGGLSSRSAFNSTLRVPGNSMSGFCANCHGNFHSSGAGGDYVDNGVSGAFLRHPSDYVIPNMTEYAAYTAYDLSAPVARPTLATASSGTVTPGTDMVMCLSCHVAHGSDQDYLLRFDYATMTAGASADIATATGLGGCLACHTTKGVLPENR
jgi:predicted CXXCH cytochrome family protein